jgi:hypothetical protein
VLHSVAFVVLAALVVVWFFAIFRWAFFHGRPPVVLTAVVILIGAISIAADVRGIWRWERAPRSRVSITAIDRGDWWQLQYDDGATRFTTANALHVPRDEIVRVNGREMLFDGPQTIERTLHVVADRDFARWFRNEASPARHDSLLFTNAGCAYCHAIRGVSDRPWLTAPDLTHFASRTTMNRAQLAGWIVDSRGLKKTSEMPSNRLEPQALMAMLDYLESLR